MLGQIAAQPQPWKCHGHHVRRSKRLSRRSSAQTALRPYRLRTMRATAPASNRQWDLAKASHLGFRWILVWTASDSQYHLLSLFLASQLSKFPGSYKARPWGAETISVSLAWGG
ncbi:hypothetical protein SAMD00023353_0702300 [Rosellinia necatrix]|uniref:Uncharacterized protein n=1 Tax=Rosellinia necatrix TaxID=77044 RepID=A0A1S8A638_ROSNE|nr:hypothetical protein SAMD00023353_0702300 [Rosellinia necatrix]